MSPFLEVFRALNTAEVRYLVIGGVAAALHGVPRMTGDIDLALSMDEQNLTLAINAITGLGFVPRAPVDAADFIDAAKREKWVREKSLVAFGLHRTVPIPLELDLLAENQFNFDEAYVERETKQIDGVAIDVLDKQRLITMKRATGRPIDLQDADALETIE
jgi:hypothetical protein